MPAQRPFLARRGWSHIVDACQQYDIGLTHVFSTAEAAEIKVQQLSPPLKKPCTEHGKEHVLPERPEHAGQEPAKSSGVTTHRSPQHQAGESADQALSPMTWLPGVETKDPGCAATQLHLTPTGSVLDDEFNRTPEFDLSDRELV